MTSKKLLPVQTEVEQAHDHLFRILTVALNMTNSKVGADYALAFEDGKKTAEELFLGPVIQLIHQKMVYAIMRITAHRMVHEYHIYDPNIAAQHALLSLANMLETEGHDVQTDPEAYLALMTYDYLYALCEYTPPTKEK